ncbi:MAG: helix-turn-helix transcriptional regulator [Bacillota bacterium]
MDLPDRIKMLRQAKGWTQANLAARVGVARDTIAGYESKAKQRQPNPDMLIRLAQAFGVTVDYLLGLTENRAAEDRAEYVTDVDPDVVMILVPGAAGRYELRFASDDLTKAVKNALAQRRRYRKEPTDSR